MPCRDYDSDGWDTRSEELANYKVRADMLARIACKALTELENNSIVEAILLRDDEVREWWIAHKEADRKAAEKERKVREREEKRQAALSKLTAEERKLLGIKG